MHTDPTIELKIGAGWKPNEPSREEIELAMIAHDMGVPLTGMFAPRRAAAGPRKKKLSAAAIKKRSKRKAQRKARKITRRAGR